MSRHEIREEIFKILFEMSFHEGEDMEALVDTYLVDTCDFELEETDKLEIRKKALEIWSKTAELDHAINEIAEGWKTNRMGKAELTILRLAVYEMKYDESVPVKVAINEAVELGKVYCNEDTPSFINGILAHFVK